MASWSVSINGREVSSSVWLPFGRLVFSAPTSFPTVASAGSVEYSDSMSGVGESSGFSLSVLRDPSDDDAVESRGPSSDNLTRFGAGRRVSKKSRSDGILPRV